MNKRLAEILARKQEIRTLLKGTEEVNVEEIEKELENLETEERNINARIELAKRMKENDPNILEKPQDELPKDEDKEKEESEERGQKLKEKRAVTVSSGQVILPKYTSDTINQTFNDVSSLIDRVQHKPLNGGESFSQPYEITSGEAGYTEEGQPYNSTEIEFGYAEITKAKVTAYSEETEEVLKLPLADYDSVIRQGISKALRKRITKDILIGDGAKNHITGIFSDKAEAINPETDIEISSINENTLDEIIFSYGGDEETEDTATLILSKADLKAFATLRNVDKDKVYDVTTNGNTGTIDGVPYIVNSACKGLGKAAAGDYIMAYGPLSNYMLAIFSDTDIQRSTDYKFKEGMIAHKGSTFVGGNVVSYNGFLRVKKGGALAASKTLKTSKEV